MSHLRSPPHPKDSMPRSLAPVAFPAQPGGGFRSVVTTVCEKRLSGTAKREPCWKNDVPTQLGEDGVGRPRSFELKRGKGGRGHRHPPGTDAVSRPRLRSFGWFRRRRGTSQQTQPMFLSVIFTISFIMRPSSNVSVTWPRAQAWGVVAMGNLVG